MFSEYFTWTKSSEEFSISIDKMLFILFWTYSSFLKKIALVIFMWECSKYFVVYRAYQLSDDEEDARRIVRSEKDKR